MQEIILAPLGPRRPRAVDCRCASLRAGARRAAGAAGHEKTAGNPFFVIQFLSALAEEGLLAFDHDAGRWSWDLDRIHAKGYTDNVVDLMVGKLTRLPAETQKALQQLACLGNSAEISDAFDRSRNLGGAGPRGSVGGGSLELVVRLKGAYRFVHDRVQEAAYSLIPEESRAEAHLRIGRLLAAHTPPEKREEAIFEIVNQLNRGAALITSRDEREQLAELNLIAGQRAKARRPTPRRSTISPPVRRCYRTTAGSAGMSLHFALELHRAECEFLTGAVADAEERLTALSTRAANTVDQAAVARLRVDLYTALRSERPRGRCRSRLPRTARASNGRPSDRRGRATRIRAGSGHSSGAARSRS